jgi:2-oxoglutarate ferredoxin oxidoreductase subunit alpha
MDLEKTLIRGNEAIGAGAIRAGCRFFFGYPITPQNELFEYMAKKLPEINGVFLQSESELSAINMIFGAAATGARCMTSSSGPGFTLMGEGLTALAAARLPAVIVCVSRAGPGLGRIASAQSDYRLAVKGGGHGDYEAVVFGPACAQELYEFTYRGFEVAERYRNPVIILADAILGQMMEPVRLETLMPLPETKKNWAVRGRGSGEQKVIKVAPHTDEELIQWNRSLKKTYEVVHRNEQIYESCWTKDARLVVVAFGSTARIASDAVSEARKSGLAVGLFRPISLNPYPEKGLRRLAESGIRRFLVIEANNGQMVHDAAASVCGLAQTSHYGVGGGYIFSPDEIRAEIENAMP